MKNSESFFAFISTTVFVKGISCKKIRNMEKLTMTKTQFWSVIKEVKNRAESENDKMANYKISGKWLVDQLVQMPFDDLMSFSIYLETYFQAGQEKYGLWSILSAIIGHLRDYKSYTYVLGWLIMQGEEKYRDVLKDPDALIDIIEIEQPYLTPLKYTNSWMINASVIAFSKISNKDEKSYFRILEEEIPKFKDEILEGFTYHPLLDYPLTELDVYLVFPKLSRKFRTMDYHDINPWSFESEEMKTAYEKGRDEMLKFLKLQWSKNMQVSKEKIILDTILASGKPCLAYLRPFDGSGQEKYLLINSPKNLADFIYSVGTRGDITITDIYDQYVLNTSMFFLDRCVDPKYCEEIKKELIPIQMGDKEAEDYIALEWETANRLFQEM